MTAITRRNVLIMTSAVAAVAAGPAFADDPKATITVGDGQLDGNRIPIGVKIPHAALDSTNKKDPLTVELHAFPAGKDSGPNDIKLFMLTVQPSALGDDIWFATGLKILKDATDPSAQPVTSAHSAQFALQVFVKQGTTPIKSADKTTVTIGPGNCPPPDSSKLSMSVQPGHAKSKTQIKVAIVSPQPLPLAADGTLTRHVKSMDLTANGAGVLSVTSDTTPYWSDEPHFTFYYQQSDSPADLSATIKYDDGLHPLQATIVLAADT